MTNPETQVLLHRGTIVRMKRVEWLLLAFAGAVLLRCTGSMTPAPSSQPSVPAADVSAEFVVETDLLVAVATTSPEVPRNEGGYIAVAPRADRTVVASTLQSVFAWSGGPGWLSAPLRCVALVDAGQRLWCVTTLRAYHDAPRFQLSYTTDGGKTWRVGRMGPLGELVSLGNCCREVISIGEDGSPIFIDNTRGRTWRVGVSASEQIVLTQVGSAPPPIGGVNGMLAYHDTCVGASRSKGEFWCRHGTGSWYLSGTVPVFTAGGYRDGPWWAVSGEHRVYLASTHDANWVEASGVSGYFASFVFAPVADGVFLLAERESRGGFVVRKLDNEGKLVRDIAMSGPATAIGANGSLVAVGGPDGVFVLEGDRRDRVLPPLASTPE